MIRWAQRRANVGCRTVRRQREQKHTAGTASRDPILLARLLIVDEEEDLVLLDWAAHRAADLVLIQSLPHAAAVAVVKKTIGVQRGIAEKLPGAPVKGVAAGPGEHVHIPTGVRAVAGVIRGGLDFEFL